MRHNSQYQVHAIEHAKPVDMPKLPKWVRYWVSRPSPPYPMLTFFCTANDLHEGMRICNALNAKIREQRQRRYGAEA